MVCLTAYTINGEQPVICTHICDQPLFYIDETPCPLEKLGIRSIRDVPIEVK